MSLAYYRWFPGDYLRDTRRLTMLQHGAYRLLLDEYMTTGRPLGNDLPALYRVCMALSGEEQAAVRYVLEEFFVLQGPAWMHRRCEAELVHQRGRSEAAKASVAMREAKRTLIGRTSNDPSNDPSNDDRTMIERSIERSSIQNQNQKEKKHSSADADMPPPGFVRFWATWPRSERKVARAECLKRWKARGLEAETEAICQHVEACKPTKQWRDGYDPAPLTYLNQRRWLDGVPEDSDSLTAGAV